MRRGDQAPYLKNLCVSKAFGAFRPYLSAGRLTVVKAWVASFSSWLRLSAGEALHVGRALVRFSYKLSNSYQGLQDVCGFEE